MGNVKITGVTITPNPVQTGAKFVISVSVSEEEVIPAILTSDGCYIETSDGYVVERTGG